MLYERSRRTTRALAPPRAATARLSRPKNGRAKARASRTNAADRSANSSQCRKLCRRTDR